MEKKKIKKPDKIVGRWVDEDVTTSWNENRPSHYESVKTFKFHIPLEWDMVFSNAPDKGGGESIPIVEPNGNIYGYAVTGYYACYGKIYKNKKDIPEDEYFGETRELYESAVRRAELQLQEIEDDCYGD